ncbi:Uncharacterized protein TCM_036523 [Theobroma cacao]|uniref:Uncharacterized protein n=1 Tax=Theobroma cacao TaxID=3641 RepID=A0A061FL15_THECC|nr:Uncharacterized protein TCM_036523 [Theobroma cacao]
MEVVMGKIRDILEEFEANMEDLGSKDNKLHGKLHETMKMLNHRDTALKELVESLRQEVCRLKDKLVALEAAAGGGALVTQLGTRLKPKKNDNGGEKKDTGLEEEVDKKSPRHQTKAITKWKGKKKKLLKFFLCKESHLTKDCPMHKKLAAIMMDEEDPGNKSDN